MDCHLNCHGELNAIILSLPFVSYVIAKGRARWREWRSRIKAP